MDCGRGEMRITCVTLAWDALALSGQTRSGSQSVGRRACCLAVSLFLFGQCQRHTLSCFKQEITIFESPIPISTTVVPTFLIHRPSRILAPLTRPTLIIIYNSISRFQFTLSPPAPCPPLSGLPLPIQRNTILLPASPPSASTESSSRMAVAPRSGQSPSRKSLSKVFIPLHLFIRISL